MDKKDALLQVITNTITINVSNTTRIGLCDGKMGVCIFLYKYAQYADMPFYRVMAEKLLNEICAADKLTLTKDIAHGLTGIGFGLCHLLNGGFMNKTATSLLDDIDEQAFNSHEKVATHDLLYNSGVFSVGLYLLARMPLIAEGRKMLWIANTMDCGQTIIKSLRDCPYSESKVSMLHSLYTVFARLECETAAPTNEIKEIVCRINKELQTIHTHKDYPYRLNEEAELDDLCREMWIDFIHNNTQTPIDIAKIEHLINLKLQNLAYYIDTINSQLAIVGLTLLNKRNFTHINIY